MTTRWIDEQTEYERESTLGQKFWNLFLWILSFVKAFGSALIFTLWLVIGIKVFSGAIGVKWMENFVPFVYVIYAPAHFVYELIANIRHIKRRRRK